MSSEATANHCCTSRKDCRSVQRRLALLRGRAILPSRQCDSSKYRPNRCDRSSNEWRQVSCEISPKPLYELTVMTCNDDLERFLNLSLNYIRGVFAPHHLVGSVGECAPELTVLQ